MDNKNSPEIQNVAESTEDYKERLGIGEETNPPFLNVPIAIIIAGLIIAGSIVYVNKGKLDDQIVAQAPKQADVRELAKNILPVSSRDHVLGLVNAPVTLVLFSDTECPFCKRFHFETVVKVMEKYVANGQVKIVYRYSPLDGLHAKARPEAESLECVAKLGGENVFWNYVNKLYTITPSNDGLEPTKLINLAKELGIDSKKFVECQNSGYGKDKVQADLQDAINSGMNGTPYSVVISPKGNKIPIEGAQAYPTVAAIIDSALAEK